MTEENEEIVIVSVRMPADLIAGLDEVARKLHNTRAGSIRLAVDQLIESHRPQVETAA